MVTNKLALPPPPSSPRFLFAFALQSVRMPWNVQGNVHERSTERGGPWSIKARGTQKFLYILHSLSALLYRFTFSSAAQSPISESGRTILLGTVSRVRFSRKSLFGR